MAIEKVTYVEPADYFNSAMRKAARKWDKEHAKKQKAEKKGKKK